MQQQLLLLISLLFYFPHIFSALSEPSESLCFAFDLISVSFLLPLICFHRAIAKAPDRHNDKLPRQLQPSCIPSSSRLYAQQ